MKSHYDSRPEAPCPLCGLPWHRGDAISKWLGKWSHEACKALRMAAVASEGQRSTLPDARGYADKKDFVDYSVINNRKAIKSVVVR